MAQYAMITETGLNEVDNANINGIYIELAYYVPVYDYRIDETIDPTDTQSFKFAAGSAEFPTDSGHLRWTYVRGVSIVPTVSSFHPIRTVVWNPTQRRYLPGVYGARTATAMVWACVSVAGNIDVALALFSRLQPGLLSTSGRPRRLPTGRLWRPADRRINRRLCHRAAARVADVRSRLPRLPSDAPRRPGLAPPYALCGREAGLARLGPCGQNAVGREPQLAELSPL